MDENKIGIKETLDGIIAKTKEYADNAEQLNDAKNKITEVYNKEIELNNLINEFVKTSNTFIDDIDKSKLGSYMEEINKKIDELNEITSKNLEVPNEVNKIIDEEINKLHNDLILSNDELNKKIQELKEELENNKKYVNTKLLSNEKLNVVMFSFIIVLLIVLIILKFI